MTTGALPGAVRATFERVGALGYRGVQLDGAQPGLRARELDRSARRDLLATLRRRELRVTGIDLWIPAAHFTDIAGADRAVDRTLEAIGLAADLGRAPISLVLPGAEDDDAGGAVAMIRAAAEREGVALVDHAVPPALATTIGIDPPAWLAAGEDPCAALARHASRVGVARLVDLLSTGMRGPAGDPRDGRLDLVAFRAAVSLAPENAVVVVDARQWTDPWAGVEASAERWVDSLLHG